MVQVFSRVDDEGFVVLAIHGKINMFWCGYDEKTHGTRWSHYIEHAVIHPGTERENWTATVNLWNFTADTTTYFIIDVVKSTVISALKVDIRPPLSWD
jgi:hypothetical protein